MPTLGGKRAAYLALIALTATVATVVAAMNYDGIVRYIKPPPQTPPAPAPFKPMITASSPAGQALPPDVRQRVISIVMNSEIVREILGEREFNISGVLPWTRRNGNMTVTGGCALISFPRPVWLEFNATDLRGRPLEYIGWVRQLTVCVDLTTGEVAGVGLSLSTRNVPRQLPETMSPRARMLVERALDVAKKFLEEKYGLSEDEVNITFYGIKNGVAVVVATPKTGDKLAKVEILMKIDVENMEVIEAYKYIPQEVYVNPKYVNITRKG